MGIFKRKNKRASFSLSETEKTLHKNLEFTASEQYRLLRTNIKFTIPEGIKCPVIGVTSAVRGEGKSTTSVNLSYVLSEQGRKVRLIDGDLRLPSVANKMGIDNTPGLTNLLLDEKIENEKFKSTLSDNWFIIPSGDIPPNPSELLGSGRMRRLLERLREEFDYIVIDLPPVNIVSDAVSVANYLTGMIVVVRENYTEKRELEQCVRQLNLANIKISGFVLNEAGGDGDKYSKYKKGKYYKYGESYGGKK